MPRRQCDFKIDAVLLLAVVGFQLAIPEHCGGYRKREAPE